MRRLIVLDVDSTLIDQEVIDLLAAHAGVGSEVSNITNRAMAGELDFETSLRERVALLKGMDADLLVSIQTELTFTKGALELISKLHDRGDVVGLVSGGFESIIEPLAQQLDIKYIKANHLEIQNQKLTGRLIGQIVDRKAKAEFLLSLAQANSIPIEATVAIGDGANDIDMVKTAGTGISFCGKAALKEASDIQIDQRNLELVLQYL